MFGNITFGYLPFGGPNLEESSSSLEVSLPPSAKVSYRCFLDWACEITLVSDAWASRVSHLLPDSIALDFEFSIKISSSRPLATQVLLLFSLEGLIQRGRTFGSSCSLELLQEGTIRGPIFLTSAIDLEVGGIGVLRVGRNVLASFGLVFTTDAVSTRASILESQLSFSLDVFPALTLGKPLSSDINIDAESLGNLSKGALLQSQLCCDALLVGSISRARSAFSYFSLDLEIRSSLCARFSFMGYVEVDIFASSALAKSKPLSFECSFSLGVSPFLSRTRAFQAIPGLAFSYYGLCSRQSAQSAEVMLEGLNSASFHRYRNFSASAFFSVDSVGLFILVRSVKSSLLSQFGLAGFVGRGKPLRARCELAFAGAVRGSRRRSTRGVSSPYFLIGATKVGVPKLPVLWEPRLIVRGVDLSHRLRSFRLSFAFDAGAWTLDLELTNHAQLVEVGEGLDPFDPISKYNTDGPLLGAYNPVTLELISPEAGYALKAFTGFVGPLDRTSVESWGEAGTVSVSCVGPSQPLKDYFIPEWEALRYTQAIISREGRPDLLNRILMDQGFQPIIEYSDDPFFHVNEYIISGVSLWEALENALAPTGFRLVEWPSHSEGLKLVVKDPIRTKTDPDRVLIGGFRSRRISGSESDVRTWVAVVYRDRNDFQEKIVWAEANPEIVEKFGIPDGKGGRKHRRMVYKTAERSLIDSESEARELAATILWDLQYPTPSFEVEIPWFDPDFRPFQLIEVIGEQLASTFGVMEIEWEWSFDNPYGSTRLRGSTGMVIGAKGLWFMKDSKKELARIRGELDRLTNEACPRPDAPEAHGAWFVQPDGTSNTVVDVYIPDIPPFWAQGIRVYIWRFRRVEEGKVESFGSNWVSPQGKTYTDYRFGASYRDYIIFTSGSAKARGRKIITTLSNRILTFSDLPPGVAVGDGFWIVRLKDVEAREIGLTNYYRITGVRAGEAVAVSIAWIPRVAR